MFIDLEIAWLTLGIIKAQLSCFLLWFIVQAARDIISSKSIWYLSFGEREARDWKELPECV